MWALFEAIWYAFLSMLKIIFWPAVVIGGIALLARLAGIIKRACSKKKK